MKKLAITVGSVLLLASLAACGASSTNTAPTDTTSVAVVPDPVPAPEPISPEDTYLADVHDMGNVYIESTSDSDLLDIGTATCSALADGNTIEDIITYLATSGTFDSTDQAEAGGMLIAAAVVDLCPEYTSQVQAYINS